MFLWGVFDLPMRDKGRPCQFDRGAVAGWLTPWGTVQSWLNWSKHLTASSMQRINDSNNATTQSFPRWRLLKRQQLSSDISDTILIITGNEKFTGIICWWMLILTVMLPWYIRCHINTRTSGGTRSPAKRFHDHAFPTEQQTYQEGFALNATKSRGSKLVQIKRLAHLDRTNFPPCPFLFFFCLHLLPPAYQNKLLRCPKTRGSSLLSNIFHWNPRSQKCTPASSSMEVTLHKNWQA